jgi:hypothetical protein
VDVDSEVDAVDLVSGIEELKQRLEILLGAKRSCRRISQAARRAEAVRWRTDRVI